MEVGEVIDQRLINRLQQAFTTDEESIFAQSFQVYLKYGDNTSDFLVDLEATYRQVGFSRKDHAFRLLVKKFKEKVDYTVETTVPRSGERQILMTIPCFKKFCLKADTKQADKIHDYYVKMEGVMHEHIKQTAMEAIEAREKAAIEAQNRMIEEMALLRLEVQQQQTYEQVECKGHVYGSNKVSLKLGVQRSHLNVFNNFRLAMWMILK